MEHPQPVALVLVDFQVEMDHVCYRSSWLRYSHQDQNGRAMTMNWSRLQTMLVNNGHHVVAQIFGHRDLGQLKIVPNPTKLA